MALYLEGDSVDANDLSLKEADKALAFLNILVRDRGVGGSNPLFPTILHWVQPGDMGDRTYLRHR
jgi:hypothetical protein